MSNPRAFALHPSDLTPVTRAFWGGVLASALIGALTWAAPAQSEEPKMIVSHGYSFFGDLKYPADFPHFDYVNPEAPKGGAISFAAAGTFDSMNPYTRKGRGGVLSSMMYESLLGDAPTGTASLPADVLGEGYGLLAERLEYPETKDWVIFHMRPEARFSDGTPVTAHDVAFSHNLLLDQGLQSYAEAVRARIPKVEVLDDHSIKFYFTEGISRRSLIDQVGAVPVWSRNWFDETGARLDESRLETSPGSGPYMVGEVDVNRSITYVRNPDYWGWHLPINKGRHNFDEIRVEYFADATAAFEAFKAGEVTFRVEGDPKQWASAYDFPAVSAGDIVRAELLDGVPPQMAGIVFNLRKDVLKDKRVREAVALGFNFEWSNSSLLFDLFSQQRSFSTGTHLEAKGVPEGEELAFLQSLGDVVPPELLTSEPLVPHKSRAARLSDRRNLRQAMKLLDEAGWPVGENGVRQNAQGAPLELEFLLNASGSETDSAMAQNFAKNLERMGIAIKLEAVDPSQYTLREREFDYDLVFDAYPAITGVGTGLQQRFGSEAAAFSLFNAAGVASPLVDAIIEAALNSTSQEEEDMMARALDRALRHEFFLIPDGYAPNHWVAYFNQYRHPETIPPYGLGWLDFWWYDAEAAEALQASGTLR